MQIHFRAKSKSVPILACYVASLVRFPGFNTQSNDHGCSQFKHPTNGTNFVIVAGGFESGYGKLDSVEILNADNANAGWFVGMVLNIYLQN